MACDRPNGLRWFSAVRRPSSPWAVRWRVRREYARRADTGSPATFQSRVDGRCGGIAILQFVRLRASRMTPVGTRRRAPENKPWTRRVHVDELPLVLRMLPPCAVPALAASQKLRPVAAEVRAATRERGASEPCVCAVRLQQRAGSRAQRSKPFRGHSRVAEKAGPLRP